VAKTETPSVPEASKSPGTKHSLIYNLLRRRYWLAAALITLIVWAVLSALIRPVKDASGWYATYPYGVMTGLDNQALDLLFQMRDARRPELRTRGQQEPITIIEIDDATIKASGVRIQKWPRDLYARLIDSASQGGAAVIGLDTFLSEAGGASAEDKAADSSASEDSGDDARHPRVGHVPPCRALHEDPRTPAPVTADPSRPHAFTDAEIHVAYDAMQVIRDHFAALEGKEPQNYLDECEVKVLDDGSVQFKQERPWVE